MSEKIRPSDVERAYTEQAKSYIDFSKKSFSWLYIEKPALDKHLQDFYKPSTRVLDSGCGNGRIIEHLIENGVEPGNITGVDITEALLIKARKNMPQVNFLKANITENNGKLPENNFDLITAVLFFHYLDNDMLEKAMENYHNLLKTEGTLFYETTHPVRMVSSSLDKYHLQGWSLEETPWGSKTPYFHRTTADYINTTIKAGFKIDAVDEPAISPEAQTANPQEYQKYLAYGPSRLIVKATKI